MRRRGLQGNNDGLNLLGKREHIMRSIQNGPELRLQRDRILANLGIISLGTPEDSNMPDWLDPKTDDQYMIAIKAEVTEEVKGLLR